MINNNIDICQLFSNVYITNGYIARSRSQSPWDILLFDPVRSAKCYVVLINKSIRIAFPIIVLFEESLRHVLSSIQDNYTSARFDS